MFPSKAIPRTWSVTKALLLVWALTNLIYHVRDPFTSCVFDAAIIAYGVYNLYVDFHSGYQEFLTLGPGGNEGLSGYVNVLFLGIFSLWDVNAPPEVPLSLQPQIGTLRDMLPKRYGPRPQILGFAPQRQANQRPALPEQMFAATNAALKKILEGRSTYLKRDRETAHVSPNSYSIWAKPSLSCRHSQAEFKFDIGHPHEIDGSLHFSLHPDDVKTVLETAWGERHPAARTNWWWTFWWQRVWRKEADHPILKEYEFSGKRPVNEGLVLIYAPRTPAELEVVKKIALAAVWWVTKREQDLSGNWLQKDKKTPDNEE